MLWTNKIYFTEKEREREREREKNRFFECVKNRITINFLIKIGFNHYLVDNLTIVQLFKYDYYLT